MEINVSFHGCSCGCTESEYVVFKGEAPDIHIAIADWAKDYMTHSQNPFNKVSIPEESKVIALEWNELYKEGDLLQNKINKLNSRKKEIKAAVKMLDVSIPSDKRKELNRNDDTVKICEKELKELVRKRSALIKYDYKKAEIIEEEEE